MKNQVLISRFFPKKLGENSADFSRNQKENRTVSRSFFFEKAKISAITNVRNFGFYQASNENVYLTKGNKEKQEKIITYSLFYWSFGSCSCKKILKKQVQIRFKKSSKNKKKQSEPFPTLFLVL